jgi:hypothetical protein
MGAVLKDGKIIFEEDEPPASRKARLAEGKTRKAEAAAAEEPSVWDTVKDYGKRGLKYASDVATGAVEGGTQGYSFGLRPRIEGLAAAAFAPPNLSAFGGEKVDLADRYNKQKEYAEKTNVQAEQNAPFTYGGSELAGAIASPIGKVVKPVVGAVKAIPGGAKIVGAAEKVGKVLDVDKKVRPVASALVAGVKGGVKGGAATGAIQSPDWTDPGRVWEDTKSGAFVGGLGGAVLGAAAPIIGGPVARAGTNIANRIKEAVRPSRQGEAARTIGQRVGGAIEGSVANRASRRARAQELSENAQGEVLESMKSAGVTPNMADTTIAEAAAQGSTANLADSARSTRGLLKGLYDKGIKGSEKLVSDVQDRGVKRGGRIREVLSNLSGVNRNLTTAAEQRASKAAAKGYATADYDKAIWGQPITMHPDIDKWFRQNRSLIQPMINESAAALRLNRAKVPTDAKVNGVRTPTIALMDGAMKRFKEKIDTLMKGDAADKGMGQAMKSQMKYLDDLLKQHNPQYKHALGRQYDEFAKQDALELSKTVAADIFSNPRQAWDKMKAFNTEYPNHSTQLREAMLSKIFDQSVNNRSLPLKIRAQIMDNAQPESRAIWNFMLQNEPKNVKALQKWIERERPMIRTEEATGGGSNTSFNTASREAEERHQQSANASAGRGALGAITNNMAMMASNTANWFQRAYQARNTAIRRMEQRMMVNELGKGRSPGEIKKMAEDVVKKQLTRQQKRAKGISRTGRTVGRYGAKATDPGMYQEPYGEE